MKIEEIIEGIKAHEGAMEGHDYILAFFYQIGMPAPSDDFVKSLVTKDRPNPNFWDVRSRWIVQWAAKKLKELGELDVFIGPCAHGRDPWTRCDECGEGPAIEAAVKRVNQLSKEAHDLKNSNNALSSRVDRQVDALAWIRKADRAGELKHLEGCDFLTDSDKCECGLKALLK